MNTIRELRGKMRTVKTCIIGVKGVGKSTILMQLSSRQTAKVFSIVGESGVLNSMDIHFNGAPFQIWDSAGPELDPDMKHLLQLKANLAIVVYDITDKQSFKALRNLIKDLRSVAHENCLVCIFANKVDRDDDRAVPRWKAERLATSLGAFYFEISAKENRGIKEAFAVIARIFKIRHQTAERERRELKDICITNTNNVTHVVQRRLYNTRRIPSCVIM